MVFNYQCFLVGLEFKEGNGVALVEVTEYQSCSKQLIP